MVARYLFCRYYISGKSINFQAVPIAKIENVLLRNGKLVNKPS